MGRYSGNGMSPDNKISTDLANRVRQSRRDRPSIVTVYNWYQEYKEKGLDKKMRFTSYKKMKTSEWHKLKKIKRLKKAKNK